MSKPSRIRAAIDFEQPGVQHSFLEVPHSRHPSAWGRLLIPITLIQNGAGPTVLLCAGNHGDEYEGQVALAKLRSSLDPSTVSGRIIILPALNYPAAQAGTRVSPVDGRNLNRSFPGRREGSITQMIAHYVDSVLLPLADVVIDFHSGGTSLEFIPSVIMHRLPNPEQQAQTAALLKAFGAPVALVLEELDSEGMLDTAVEERGAIFLTTELAGGARLDPDGLRAAEVGIRNVLVHVGVVPGELEVRPTRLLGVEGPGRFILAPEPGLYEQLVPLGAAVEPDQPVGQLVFIDQPERPPLILTSTVDGILWGRRTLAPAERGDCLAVVASDLEEAALLTPARIL
jgi:N-alpha-acetyl-L-2,4-diaminobutyrate deacetylase